MTDPSKKDDELAGTEQPFVQHLVELRDRLVKAAYGIGAVLIVLLFYPGPSQLYDLLATPLVKALPEGCHDDRTSALCRRFWCRSRSP